MTEQYGQRNINDPAGARAAANTVLAPDFALTASDVGKLVLLDNTLAAAIATLPSAAEAGAGAEITVIAGAAISLTIAPAAGDNAIVKPAGIANPSITINASKILRSDGVLTWYIVAGLA